MPEQADGVNRAMAESNQGRTVADSEPADGPVLRPGRPADPVPASPPDGRMPATTTGVSADNDSPEPSMAPGGAEQSPAAASDRPAVATGEPAGDAGPEGAVTPETEQQTATTRQNRLRRLLRQCDRVLLLDFNTLAMSGWPDAFTVAMARRRRDLWLMLLVISGLVFASGITGFVPAWIAGSGLGAMFVLVLSGIPAIRHLFTDSPSYLELLLRRRQLLHEARLHIQNLEGPTGLIWQCPQMQEFNPGLRASRFAGIIRLSEQRVLSRSLTRREHVRLCLVYLMEAEKAYERLQQAYFVGHQTAIDRGWLAVAAEPGQGAAG